MVTILKGPGHDKPEMVSCNLPEGEGAPEPGLDLGGWDVEQAMNARDWLENAIVAAGAEITDAGMGMGGADLGFKLDGAAFSVKLKPRIR